MVQQITDPKVLKEELKKAGDKLVVIDFFAEWCGPCKDIAPFIQELSKKYPNVVFLKIDVDTTEMEKICQDDYKIECMPTFKFIKNEKVVESFEGANETKLEDLVKKHSK